jgi:hypothetical protein
MSQSNLANCIRELDRCSEDELRQIQALITARLSGKSAGKARRSASSAKGSGGKKGSETSDKPVGKASSAKKKGNPQRTSQYATHPVYKRYKEAKKAAETAAKTLAIPFRELTGETRDSYDVALNAWIQTKSGFRGYEPEQETEERPSPVAEEGQETDEGTDTKVVAVPNGGAGEEADDAQGASVGSNPDRSSDDDRRLKRRRSKSPKKAKYQSPPAGWQPADGEEWEKFSHKERKAIWKMASQPPQPMEE